MLVSLPPGLRAGCELFSDQVAGPESLKPKSGDFALHCVCLTHLSIQVLHGSIAKSAVLCILKAQAVLGSSYVSHSWRPVHSLAKNSQWKFTCCFPSKQQGRSSLSCKNCNILEETPVVRVTKQPSFCCTLNLIVMLHLLTLNYTGKWMSFIDPCMRS